MFKIPKKAESLFAKLVAITSIGFLSSPSIAGTVTMVPQSTNAQVMTTGTSSPAYANVGDPGNVYGSAVVYPFALPKLAFGDHVTGATFSINMGTNLGGTFNGDLYSLGVSSSNAVSTGDYFNGIFGSDPNAIGLQAGFLYPTMTTGTKTTNASTLAADINNYYASGKTAGSFYFLRLSPSFTTVPDTKAGWNVSLTQDVAGHQPSLTLTTAHSTQMGRVLWEYWANLDGNATLNDLTNPTINPNYPAKPSGREYPTVVEIPYALDMKSGDRMRCYFTPPTTGAYTFAVASNGNSELLFSMDGNPADATVIASLTEGNTLYQQWNKYSSQEGTVNLVAGQKYYMEAQHKSAEQTNLMSIGLQSPGESSITLMPATYCTPYDPAPAYTAGAIANSTQAFVHPRLILSPAAVARLASEVTTGTPQFNQAQSYTWQGIYEIVTNENPTTGATLSPAAKVSTTAGEFTAPLIGTAIVNAGPTPSNGAGNFRSDDALLQVRLDYLALFYLVESRLKPTDPNLPLVLNQIYAELQGAANWGAGLGGSGYNTGWAHYQSLDMGPTAYCFAEAYDWCYAGWTPTQRAFLVNQISTQCCEWGVNCFHTGGVFTGGGNWQIVTNTNIANSSIAILGDETGTAYAPTLLDEMIPQMPSVAAFQEESPDGGWSEGPGYWNWVTGSLANMFAGLETSAGTCFGLDQLGGMSSMGSFSFYCMGPNTSPSGEGLQPNCYNFADENAGWGPMINPGLQYLAVKYNQPHYAYRENKSTGLLQGYGLQEPYDMIWYDALGSAPDQNVPSSTYFMPSGLIFLRSASYTPNPAGANAWSDANQLYVGMKAGFNEFDGGTYTAMGAYGGGHSDMELGSFVFDACGVRWAQDLGTDSYGYYNYFQLNPVALVNRWMYYRKRAEGNNTLVLNPSPDGGQSLSATAPLLNFKSSSATQQAIIDLTTAYNATAGYPNMGTVGHGNVTGVAATAVPVTSLHRGCRMVGGAMQMQDEITSNSTTTMDLNWFMHTATTIGATGSNTVLLTAQGSTLKMTIQSPAGAVFKSMLATPMPWSPNQAQETNSTSKVWIEYTMPAGTQTTTLTVSFQPYVNGQAIPALPAVTSLANW